MCNLGVMGLDYLICGVVLLAAGRKLYWLFVAAVGFTMFTTHLYVLSKLAARIPHDRLADSARRLLYGFGYGTVIFAFFVLAAPGVALLIAVGLFVLAINYVVLLARVRGAMARVLVSAQASMEDQASAAAVTR